MSERVIFSEALQAVCSVALSLIAKVATDSDGNCSITRDSASLGDSALDSVIERVFNDDPSCDKITIIK